MALSDSLVEAAYPRAEATTGQWEAPSKQKIRIVLDAEIPVPIISVFDIYNKVEAQVDDASIMPMRGPLVGDV
jgi:hypothetical protein